MTEYVTHMGDERYFEYNGLAYDDETGLPVSSKQIVDLLNENEQLKSERDYFEKKKCEYFNKYNLSHLDNINLKKEKEQLKQQNSRLMMEVAEYSRKVRELEKGDVE